MRDFRKYDFWIDSRKLVKDIYQLTKQFPKEEQYGLIDQTRRAVESIPANIAEGAGRASSADFAHFLDIAVGSSFETETHIEIACDLGYITALQKDQALASLQSISRRLNLFLSKLRSQSR